MKNMHIIALLDGILSIVAITTIIVLSINCYKLKTENQLLKQQTQIQIQMNCAEEFEKMAC